MVSGLRNRLRNTLLHADAIVFVSKNISILSISINSRLYTRHACLGPWSHFDSKIPDCACCRIPPISDYRTKREILSCPLRSSRSCDNTRLLGWGLRSLGFAQYLNSGVPRFSGRHIDRLWQLTQCAQEKRYAVQKNHLLHLYAHFLQFANDQFGVPFQQDGPIQDEMIIGCFCVVGYRDNFGGPGHGSNV